MGTNGSIYERELKGIFSGETERLEKMKWIDEDLKDRIKKKPFLVVRAAGSHGFDIILIRDDISLPIEIKSSKEKTINFSSSSKRSQFQAEYYVDVLKRTKVMPIYAYRTKNVSGDPWRIFTFDLEYTRNYRLLSEIIPKLEISRSGSYTMKWDKGLSLISLLEYLF